MKIQTHRSTTLFGAITVALLVLIALVFTVNHRASAADGQDLRGGHLITIHDRGEQKVILTHTTTIGAAIKEAGITLDKNDAVEPVVDQQLVASEYQVNIYHARPVIVVDGAVRQKVITPYQTAEQIAKSAGVTLYPEDTTTITRTDNIISEGAGLVLKIDRATPVAFNLYGKATIIRTHATTVEGLLKDKAIILGKDDSLSVSLAQPVTSGMSIELWRNGKQTVNVDEDVAFDIQKIQDANQPVGYRQVTTAGIVGKKTVTYEVDMKNGQEVSRNAIQDVVILQPVKQIEVIGAKYRGAYTTPGQNEVITWNFLLSNGFNREQTAGIMGNLKQEHGFNTTGDGLAQWTGSRKANLLSRPDPYNIYTQLDFLMYELNGGYSGVRDAIKSAGSVNEAVVIFQNRFERCSVCVESQRVQYAFNILASH